jgi:hypothetical protein
MNESSSLPLFRPLSSPTTHTPSLSTPPSTTDPALRCWQGMDPAILVAISSLCTLHALGIVSIPMQHDAPTSPATLCGTSIHVAMLNLEISVSLLQAVQMSGLALMVDHARLQQLRQKKFITRRLNALSNIKCEPTPRTRESDVRRSVSRVEPLLPCTSSTDFTSHFWMNELR